MPDTTETITGIEPAAEPCCELFNPATGYPFESMDTVPHFVSKAEAESMAEARDDDEDGPFEPRQLPSPCFTATAVCGLPFETDGGGIAHWATAEEARREVLDCDWRVIDGVLRCEDHEECRPARPVVDVHLPAADVPA